MPISEFLRSQQGVDEIPEHNNGDAACDHHVQFLLQSASNIANPTARVNEEGIKNGAGAVKFS
jgi:hypothetical protein